MPKYDKEESNMPKYDKEDSNIKETLTEKKNNKKCSCSNRCKLVLCISASTLIMIGISIIDIYYAETYDGSDLII